MCREESTRWRFRRKVWAMSRRKWLSETRDPRQSRWRWAKNRNPLFLGSLRSHGDFLCRLPARRMVRFRDRAERTSLIERDSKCNFRKRIHRVEIDACNLRAVDVQRDITDGVLAQRRMFA